MNSETEMPTAPESQTEPRGMSSAGNHAPGYPLQQLAAMMPRRGKRRDTKSPYRTVDARAKAKNERKVRKEQKMKARKKK